MLAALLACRLIVLTATGEPAPPPPVLAEAPLAPVAPAPRSPQSLYDEAQVLTGIGHYEAARAIARAGLAADPQGPLAPAFKRLVGRIQDAERAAAEAPGYAYRLGPAGARAYTVTVGAVVGLAEGLTLGGAAEVSGGAEAAVGALGLVLGVGLPLLGYDFIAQPAVAPHLLLGGLAGTGVELALIGLLNPSGNAGAFMVAAGLPVGALAGALFGGFADVTEGDAGAGLALMLHLTVTSAAFALAGSSGLAGASVYAGVCLASGAAGLLAGELGNRLLRWSEGRWGLIEVGGALGALLGGVVAGTAGGNGGLVAGAVGAGDLVGLAVAMVLTRKLSDEAPRADQPEAPVPAVVQTPPPAASAAPNPFVPTLIPPAAAYTLRF